MIKRKKLWIAILITVVVSNIIIIIGMNNSSYKTPNFNSSYADNSRSNMRVMIIVPHQDDELLMASSVIRNSVLEGKEVYIVFATNGDYEDLSKIRFDEAISAMSLLGVPEENLIFLGYGDMWNTHYKHIYHAPSDEIINSHNNKVQTYGTYIHPDFRTEMSGEASSYTRNNYKNDLEDAVLQYLPDELYVIDFDSNPDHRTVSLLFDEAIFEILKINEDYTPKLYKGFAYNTSLFAAKDFYSLNMLSTPLPPQELSSNTISKFDNPYFSWEDRIRFSVPSDMLSYNLRSNLLYKALRIYKSQKQYTVRFAQNSINSDQVFWERRTDSFSYNGKISASSGNPNYLNDFKLFDAVDVTEEIVEFTNSMWSPSISDSKMSVLYTFDTPIDIGSLIFYDNPNLYDNIHSGEVTFSDGSTISIGGIHADGSPSKYAFAEKKNITCIEFSINEYEGIPGLCEWEVYPKIQESVQFIKIMLDNNNQTFIYKYICPDNSDISFDVYEYPKSTDFENTYKISLINEEGKITILNNKNVSLEPSFLPKKYKLRIESIENPAIYDEAEIVSYNPINSIRIKLLQAYEKTIEEIIIFKMRVIAKIKETHISLSN